MSAPRLVLVAAAMAGLVLVGCNDIRPPRTAFGTAQDSGTATQAATPSVTPGATNAAGAVANAPFVAPDFADIPDNEFGEVVRRGRDIFTNTPKYAGEYAGNGLSCSNCHMDAGRQPDAAPLWGAFGRYPAYRKKNQKVNSYTQRMQECFMYSLDGTEPPAEGPEIEALTAYSFWLAKGVPIGVTVPGAGFRKDFKAELPPSYARGETVYQDSCALCHGADGQGQKVAGAYAFPPLWGSDSFNWGAGMHSIDNAAAFIKYNMPLGRGGSLSDQEAWDVALFMDSHERPQDPRFTGDVADTRAKFHDSPYSQYGIEVNGRVLGANPSK